MKQQELNVQISIFLFVNLIFNLIELLPTYTEVSKHPVLLFVLRFAVCFSQFFFFMMLPKSTISFTRRRDFLAHNRIQEIKEHFIVLNLVNMFASLYFRVSVQEYVFEKLMQYELVVLVPAALIYIVFNIVALVGFIFYEEIVFRESRVFICVSIALLLIFGFWEYFFVLNKAEQQIQVNYNINKEIDKIFAFQPAKEVNNGSYSDDGVETREVSIDFMLRSSDSDEEMVTKYSALCESVQLVCSLFNARFVRQNIDKGTIVFESFLNYDTKHFVVCANIIDEMAVEYEISVTLVIGSNGAITEALALELDPGVYFIDLKCFPPPGAPSERIVYDEIVRGVECVQNNPSLETDEKIGIFKEIVRLLPPEFCILELEEFEYAETNIQLATLEPNALCEYITEIFILKFELMHLDKLQKQDNIMEYEQIIEEINQQLMQLFEMYAEELVAALPFCKIETGEDNNSGTPLAHSDPLGQSKSEILTARHQPERMEGQEFSYMSKGDDYNENHIRVGEIGSGSVITLLTSLKSHLMYFIDVSRYLETEFATHFLLRAALIKARASYKSYFYMPMVICLFLPVYLYYAVFEGFGTEIVSVLGMKVSYYKLLLLVLAEQTVASILQVLTCFEVFLSTQRLFGNKNNSENDSFSNILNFNNQKILNYPKIGVGRELTFFVYENLYYLSQFQLYYAIESLDISADHENYNTYEFMMTLPLFFNLLFQEFLSTILAIPEEFVSINFFIMIFHNLVFILTGLLMDSMDFILMGFIIVVMLVYQFFELREFICFGKQEEQNFNMLKLRNKTFENKFSSFNMLVYNILASKYVVLNNIIESNYVVRRARVVEENEDELSLKIGFYEKIYHHFATLRDREQRETCLIDYSDVIICVFKPCTAWTYDLKIDYEDFVNSQPELYQLPLKYPNVCCFIESSVSQHLYNAFEVVLAYAEGARKRFNFQAMTVAAGPLRIFVLQNGSIHVQSTAIQAGFDLLGDTGMVVEGRLFEKYRIADAKFRSEISSRIKRCTEKEEQERLLAMIWHLGISYVNNGRSVLVHIKE